SVLSIITLKHIGATSCTSILEDTLVVFWKIVELLEVYESVNRRATFPPSWVVVVLSNLIEAELLVVIWTNEFSRVDCALFKSCINVAASDLLRCNANLLHNLTSQTSDTHFQTLE